MRRTRAGLICKNEGSILSIKHRDPRSKKEFWSLPGGGIEKGETPIEAAIRETREETGYEVSCHLGSFTNTYDFYWNGELYDCETHWFFGELVSEIKKEIEHEEHIIESKWLAWPNCKSLFNHKAALLEALNFFL
ncbi:MAG: NUDIX hydrolase [Gammaproteobacteria bacterium]|nr:NUDIX hydrolase [Gammaproteobacteria bacterium]